MDAQPAETTTRERRQDEDPTGTGSDRPYPSEWEADVVLADGGTVHARPIRPEDGDALVAFHSRLSPETVYYRFFTAKPTLPPDMVERFTHLDYASRMAFVAELGDELVGVVRYDRIPGSDEADVAFVVSDEHQGRGIGTILLEHLAAAARRQGIRRFVADTLATNRRMIDLFSHMGFEVERRFEEGVVHVAFPIDPTPESAAAVAERERRAEARSVARILSPRAIAVVGASRDRGTIGHELFRNLLEGGFEGPVYPVNPSARTVASVRAFPSVLDVPDELDLAVIVVPAPLVEQVVRECAEKRVRGLVVISAGFAEAGEDGRGAQRRLVELARRNGMRMVGPNCMGVVNTHPDVRMNATFAPVQPAAGRVGFLSQSGALGIAVLERATRTGLGVSSFVSVGNKGDVSGNDLLQYWEGDAETDVILLYLESFGNPAKFARLARRVSRTKPIVAVKSGRSSAGTRAASSHTAAMASPDVAVDALFRQAGVVRVDTLAQLFEVGQVLATQPLPRGRRVAIVGNSGGPGILAADACEGAGLTVPELTAGVQDELRSFLPAEAAVGNPVDLIASASAADYERALRTVLADDGVDAAIVVFTPPLVTEAADVAEAVLAVSATVDKPVIANFLAGGHGETEVLHGTGPAARSNVPSFPSPEAAAQALARVASYAEWRRRPEGEVPRLPDADVDGARAVVEAALTGTDDARLDAAAASDLLARYGIPVTETVLVSSADGAVAEAERLGFPVVLKVAAPDIVHKTDVGGVRIGLASAEEVRAAYAEMAGTVGDAMGGAVVQPMVRPGVETIVGVVHDPLFGPLTLFGMGGIATELLGDTAFHLVPLTDVDAAELVRSVRGSALLFGYRGAEPVDVDALEALLLRVGALAADVPELAEMDLNPVIVSRDGAVAVDAKVRLARPPSRPDPTLRRLR